MDFGAAFTIIRTIRSFFKYAETMKFGSARELPSPSVAVIFVAVLAMAVCPMHAQAPNSPVGNHLVGTVLGTPVTQGVQDTRETVSHAGLSDFVFQPNGEMIFASSVENRLFRADAGGLVEPFAGDGGLTNNGDGGEAIAASVVAPHRLAADAAGNVYVAHLSGIPNGGYWIRRISPSGTIHEVVGGGRMDCPEEGSLANGADLFAVSAMAASADALYFAVQGCGKVYRVGEDGLVAVFAGIGLNELNKIELTGDFLAVPAKRAAFRSITDLAIDPVGNVLVADQWSKKILRVTPAGVVLHAAGGPLRIVDEEREGNAKSVYFPAISSIAALPDGSILVVQASLAVSGGREELGMIDAAGAYRILFTSDGANGRPAASLGSRRIVPNLVRAAPDGSFYVRERFSGMILCVLPDGSVQHFLGLPPKPETVTMNGKLSAFEVQYTTTPAADADGNIYFGALGKLYRLSLDGDLTHIAGNGGGTPGGGDSPLDAVLGINSYSPFEQVQIDAGGSLYWHVQGSIRKLAKDGTISRVVGGDYGITLFSAEGEQAVSVSFTNFTQWAVAANGDIYFVYTVRQLGSRAAPVIWRVGAGGVVERVAGAVVHWATGQNFDGKPAREAEIRGIDQMSVSPDGVVFFASEGRIYRIDSQGIVRLVTNSVLGAALVDGMPTASAPGYLVLLRAFRALAADQLLVVSPGSPMRLAKYTVGGLVRVWRDGAYGIPNNDGALLKDDRLLESTAPPLRLPDGGLVWIEVQRDRSIVRRSFPVPAGCTYAANANELSVGGGNALLSLTLTTGPECPWTVGASSNWLEILSARYGKGTVTINLRVVANTAPVERVGTLRVAGKEVLVRQGASVRPDIFVVSPVSAVVPPGGGSVRVTISSSPGLSWQAGLPAETPVGIEGPSAGSGSGSFVLNLGALPANVSERTAVVSVNDKTVTLRQTAASVSVPVTIDSTLAGTKAVIDLVERPLPYVAQWTPGSYHLFQAQPFTKVSDDTLIQFENFGASDPAAEQMFIAPSTPATLTARFRYLYLLRGSVETDELFTSVKVIPNFRGIPVPSEFGPLWGGPTGFAMWYPGGSTVQVFASESDGRKFSAFTGKQSATDNPASVLMDGPGEIMASYVVDSVPRPELLSGVTSSWRLYGEERQASPAQVAVGSFLTEPEPLSHRFVEYQSPIGTPEWLSFRASGTTAPFTLEAGVDAAKAAGLKTPDFGESAYFATVHLYEPGGSRGWLTAAVRTSAVPADERPWIAAVTDAGGFRQSTGLIGTSELVAAPGMILTIFGLRFGTKTLDAPAMPLPTSLGGVSVEFRRNLDDQWMPLPLFFVSPAQINFQVSPAMVGDGRQRIYFRVRISETEVSDPWLATVARRVVSLFSADSSGGGAPAGFYVRVAPNETQQRGDLYECVDGVCTVPATAFGGPDNDLFLEIYGTGFHNLDSSGDLRAYLGGRTAEVTFAGPHEYFAGLDQVNIKVPRDIEKGVPLDLYVWVRNDQDWWTASNRLVVRFE